MYTDYIIRYSNGTMAVYNDTEQLTGGLRTHDTISSYVDESVTINPRRIKMKKQKTWF